MVIVFCDLDVAPEELLFDGATPPRKESIKPTINIEPPAELCEVIVSVLNLS